MIKEITKEYDGDMQEVKEVKEKYERKKMVSDETKDAIDQEIVKCDQLHEEFKQKLINYDSQISGFALLSKGLKSHLRREERSLDDFETLVKEYECKIQDLKEMNKHFAESQQEFNSAEWELQDYQKNKSKPIPPTLFSQQPDQNWRTLKNDWKARKR